MKNTYKVLKDKHQQKINEFPIFFAFSNEQFDKGMKNLGLNPCDIDKIYKLGDTSGFYRRDDAEKLQDMFNRQDKEMRDAIEADTTGEGFIFDMFDYELGNHEYVVTYDVSDALAALGLTAEEVHKSEKLLRGLNKAMKSQREWYALHG